MIEPHQNYHRYYVIDNTGNNVGICFDSGHHQVHFNDELNFEN